MRVLIAGAGIGGLTTIPEVPTSAESGLKGFEVPVNLFLMAPASTPAPVIARLNGAMKTVVGREDFRNSLQAQAVVAAHQTPEQAAQLVRDELAKWTKVIRDANIKPE